MHVFTILLILEKQTDSTRENVAENLYSLSVTNAVGSQRYFTCAPFELILRRLTILFRSLHLSILRLGAPFQECSSTCPLER